MRFLFILMVLLFASASSAKAFDMTKCIQGCNSDSGCIEKCRPAEPEEAEETAVVQNNSTAVPGSNETTLLADEESGICAPAIILAGLAGLVIRNAEREI